MELTKKKENLEFLDNNKVFFNELEIILTEKCNLSCKHCMRGDATQKSISKETLNALFKKIKGINNLCLGGGEISLAPETISMVVDVAEKNKVFISKFNLTLNGTNFSDELVSSINKINNYAQKCRLIYNPYFDSPENSPVLIGFSLDDYHMVSLIENGYNFETILKNIEICREKFPYSYIEIRDGANISLIDDGRAIELNDEKTVKVPNYELTIPILNKPQKKAAFIGGFLTISTDGDFVKINSPYKNKNSYGNIINENFKEIFENMHVKVFTNNKKFYQFDHKQMIDKCFIKKSEIKKVYKNPDKRILMEYVDKLQKKLNSSQRQH